MRFSCAGLAGVLSLATCGVSNAATHVLDFDFERRGYETVIAEARAKGIEIEESNYGAYGLTTNTMILGNDGLLNRSVVSALLGHVFDARSIVVDSVVSEVAFVSCDGVAPVPDPIVGTGDIECSDPDFLYVLRDLPELFPPEILPPQLMLEGRRAGSGELVTASVELEGARTIDIAALDDFSGLDRLELSILGTSPSGIVAFDASLDGWLTCYTTSGCGLMELDDLALDIRSLQVPVAPVPLPGGGALMVLVLGGLGLVQLSRKG